MDDVVRIEYRGMSQELAVGSSMIVESCEAGVLVLRRAPAEKPAPAQSADAASKKKAAA